MSKIIKQYEENGVQVYHLQRVLSFKEAEARKSTYINSDDYDFIVDHDADGYDAATGELLFRFRKGAMPKEILMAGVENYMHSIKGSNNRGDSAGGTKERLNKDGTPSGIFMADDVDSGGVGYLNGGGMQPYCRLTAFGRDEYEKFQLGRPFVDYIDEKYKELCPEQHKIQLKTANETNANYVLWDTAFSTITVNKDFRTAIHQDAGDHPEGFGNLFVYREGDWSKGYFTLLEYGVCVDMHNQDMLFVDVHRFHANDEFDGLCTDLKSPDYKKKIELGSGDNLRISFVLYYRTGLRTCKSPSEQVKDLKHSKSSYLRI